MNEARRNRAGGDFEGVTVPRGGHIVPIFELVNRFDLVAPQMRAAHHAHAAVVLISVIERDPTGELHVLGRENRPIRRILVPHIDAAGCGGLVLDLIVEQSQFVVWKQLCGFFG